MNSLLSQLPAQTPFEWSLLVVTALLIGMSKTGIQGINMLMIPLMAIAFGAKPSTGVILPMLCFSDLLAVIYYRRQAEWKHIVRLLPAAIAGFGLAVAVDRLIPPAGFRILLAGCLLLGLAIMIYAELRRGENKLAGSRWYGPLFGLAGGFTTMIGNAAGPVMAIYLLSVKLPKYAFVGTSAWFFLVVNYLKLPIQIYAWENINPATLTLNLCMIPFMIAGALCGIYIVRKLPEDGFRKVIIGVTVLSTLILLL
ncbi:MAG: sulfite exporter TauE/SafE family protein [Tannerellaceae bacterium]|nr:sulfite exporter TauE/SafE family protein [Tannerellaceae bacterium]